MEEVEENYLPITNILERQKHKPNLLLQDYSDVNSRGKNYFNGKIEAPYFKSKKEINETQIMKDKDDVPLLMRRSSNSYNFSSSSISGQRASFMIERESSVHISSTSKKKNNSLIKKYFSRTFTYFNNKNSKGNISPVVKTSKNQKYPFNNTSEGHKPVENTKNGSRRHSIENNMYLTPTGQSVSNNEKKRAVSENLPVNNNQVMNRLNFENIELRNTPLSSLKSCSEYNKVSDTGENKNTMKVSGIRSEVGNSSNAWSNWICSQSSAKKKKRKKKYANRHKVHFKENDHTTSETLDSSFNNRSINSDLLNNSSFISTEDVDCSGALRTSQESNEPLPAVNSTIKRQLQSTRSKYSRSVLQEATLAIEMLFSFGGKSSQVDTSSSNQLKNQTKHVMEIELKNLKPPIYYNYYDQHSGNSAHSNILYRETSFSEIITENILVDSDPLTRNARRRINSYMPMDNISEEEFREAFWNELCIAYENFQPFDRNAYSPLWLKLSDLFLVLLRKLQHYQRAANDHFYENIRIQPFSSGAYLRGMLLAGMSSLFFQVYNLLSFPSQETLRMHTKGNYAVMLILSILYLNLLLQVLLNLIQLPCRLRIHYLCWESSRAVEVDAAINALRTMLRSDSWMINKFLGHILDFLAIFNLIVTEIFLWISWTIKDGGNSTSTSMRLNASTLNTENSLQPPMAEPIDVVRELVVSLCATNLLTFVCRVAVATSFSLSMHDPQVLVEARRRGLSKLDLEVLPTFVYASKEEVNNHDCPICLGGFSIGEMLISLPCDNKHSFHASCIREWLQRQNSCPLCQKLV